MAEDVQDPHIVRPVLIAQDVDIVAEEEHVVFVEEVLLEKAHPQGTQPGKVDRKETPLQILISHQSPINLQKFLLMRLMSTLIPTTDILQELQQQISMKSHHLNLK